MRNSRASKLNVRQTCEEVNFADVQTTNSTDSRSFSRCVQTLLCACKHISQVITTASLTQYVTTIRNMVGSLTRILTYFEHLSLATAQQQRATHLIRGEKQTKSAKKCKLKGSIGLGRQPSSSNNTRGFSHRMHWGKFVSNFLNSQFIPWSIIGP